MSSPVSTTLASSFRDPSGHLFEREGVLYRSVEARYASHYDRLMGSGLYAKLVAAGLLVPHEEVTLDIDAYRVLRPERIPFISYPYEWCFGMLRHAALATLRIHSLALDHGMTLKDASAYNIQFRDGRPCLIDTLSFEAHSELRPWIAYRQFCEHFLAPLALMAHRDPRLNVLLADFLDGIPLDLASKLLPWSCRLRPGLALHVFAHARAQRSAAKASPRAKPFSRRAMDGLIESLRGAVRGLRYRPQGTVWGDYYAQTNYETASEAAKRELVDAMLGRIDPRVVWDLGANDGRYSLLASRRGAFTVAFDFDPAAVEAGYRATRESRQTKLLHLRMDLSNPSPALGWAHCERESLLDRGPADCVLALALIHHLAIGNNVPWPQLAAFFRRAGRHLIVEFVPKEDSQVVRMLASREDIFDQYDAEHFEHEFARYFELRERVPIAGTLRTLYRFEAR